MKLKLTSVSFLLLFLATPIFISCESESIQEESSLYETINRSAIDKEDAGSIGEKDPEDTDSND